MLTFYPSEGLYVAGCKSKGYMCIDKDSSAYVYCEYLRSHFGATEEKDLDGDLYLKIMVSDFRVEQIHTFVGLENKFKYLMAKEL